MPPTHIPDTIGLCLSNKSFMTKYVLKKSILRFLYPIKEIEIKFFLMPHTYIIFWMHLIFPSGNITGMSPYPLIW